MATTRKMSVDNAEGLLEAVRSHTTKRHEGVVRWYTEKKHYGFIEAPGAAATDLFVHASEVTEPLRAGDKVSFVIGERRGRSAATKVEVLERAPPPPLVRVTQAGMGFRVHCEPVGVVLFVVRMARIAVRLSMFGLQRS